MKFRADPLRALAEAIPRAPERARASARAEALSRPIYYPFGSGESDEIALLAGLRPLIRQLLSDDELSLTSRFLQRGFVVEPAPLDYVRTGHGWAPGDPMPGEARQPVFIGRDRGRVLAAVECEMCQTNEADRELGRMLGYPRCCVEAFVENAKVRENPETIRAALARTRSVVSPRLNVLDLAVFHWVSWYPCAFDCGLSLRYADAVAAIVASREPKFAREIDHALGLHRLMLLDGVQMSIAGVWDGRTLAIESVHPTSRDRNARSALSSDELAAVTAITALLRQTRTVRLAGDAIVVDDRTIALPCRPLIVPFGTVA